MEVVIKENRINKLFERKQGDILSVFYTAGFPQLQDTGKILLDLQGAGVDMVEIGIPFSDPIADGETIQKSSQAAIENGITLETIFDQLEQIKDQVHIPVILMGYLNPVFQYGWESFCKRCSEVGVDGLIFPDLPMDEFETIYKKDLDQFNIKFHFLITPQTSEERIRRIDEVSDGFIYVVSTASTTGKSMSIDKERSQYFERINDMNLKNETMIGFGIHDHNTFRAACEYANGAIIGSAFIKLIQGGTDKKLIKNFINSIKQ